MHWELSDEQNLYADSLREWLGARAASEQVRTWLDADDQRPFDRALIEEGWAGVGFDESVGGQGGGLLELALTSRELGRAAAPSARWLARTVAAAALTGAPELVQAALDGSDLTVAAVRCDRIPSVGSATWRDGRLSGQVPCVLAAGDADRFLVPATTPDRGTILTVVERGTDGVEVRPRAVKDSNTFGTFFDTQVLPSRQNMLSF